jgi:replicative DNA helicase
MSTEGLVPIGDAIQERFKEIENIKKGHWSGAIPTGFSDLDTLLQGGFRKCDLSIICARPGMGKSSFQLAIALNVAGDGRSVGVFSLEMSIRALTTRLLSMKSLVTGESIRTGRVTDAEFAKLREAGEYLSSLPIYIDDSGGLTVMDIRERLSKQPCEMVFVDYLQRLYHREAIGETEMVTKVSRGLKDLAKEFGVPFVVACQLSREIEKRRDKRPRLSDLRQSGQIEQDADSVIGLYRAELYDDDPSFTGYCEAHVIKQRDGQLGVGKLSFAAPFTLFTNYSSVGNVPQPDTGNGNYGDWQDLGD